MIAVDSSVLVAVVKGEPDHAGYAALMSERDSIVGAPSLLESRMALSRLPDLEVEAYFDRIRRDGRLAVVDFTPAMAEVAIEAFRRYGKGRGHPAQLNFGDCLSYAVAKVRGVPLLFKGDDFALTDIEPAWRP